LVVYLRTNPKKSFFQMSILKKLAGESAIYGLNSILGRFIVFFLVSLHTRAFSNPSEMAIIVKLFSIVTFLNVLYTYGMETAFFRYARSKDYDFRVVYNTSLGALFISSLLLSGICVVFAPAISFWLGGTQYSNLVVWFAVIMGLDAVVSIPFARLRLENKAKRFVAIRFCSYFLNIGLNYFWLYFAKTAYDSGQTSFLAQCYKPSIGVGYIVLANLLANLVYIPLLWPELWQKFHFKINKPLLGKMWHYGYPILILGLAGMVNQQIDRSMLDWLLPTNFYNAISTDAAIGIYGNCYKLAMIISLATQSFRFAADPFFFSKAEDKNAPALFARVTKWFTIVCCVLWLGISLNLDLIGLIIGKSYRSGLAIVPYIMFGNVLLGIYYNLAVWFKLTDKTLYGTYITLLGALINFCLNYLLIPKLGYMGCAYAFAISCLSMVVLCYLLGQKHFPIPYQTARIVSYVLLCFVFSNVSENLAINNPILNFLAKNSFGILFLGLVYMLEKPQKN
jgi:O-antigen/teichoic acid export membrane protein